MNFDEDFEISTFFCCVVLITVLLSLGYGLTFLFTGVGDKGVFILTIAVILCVALYNRFSQASDPPDDMEDCDIYPGVK